MTTSIKKPPITTEIPQPINDLRPSRVCMICCGENEDAELSVCNFQRQQEEYTAEEVEAGAEVVEVPES